VQIFPLREGKMIDRYAFHLENVEGRDIATVLEEFSVEYYGSAPSIPPQIIVPRDAGDLSALEEFLSSSAGRASRCARRSAARSAGSRSSRRRTPRSPSRPRRTRPSCGAYAGSKRSRNCARC
jgi:excinuclease UvrABC nuclease subunit